MENQQQYTVNQILDRFVRDYIPTLGARTQKDYARHVVVLRAMFGTRIADELRAKDFAGFMDVKKGKIQRNRQLAVLSCAFSEAVCRWYMMDRNPCRDVKRNPSRPRNRYVTNEEFDAVRALANVRMRCAMDLALLTGQRQGDIITLKWSQIVDMGILITQGKTGKRLSVQVTPTVEAVLDRCWMLKGGGNAGAEHVLPTRSGKPYTSEGFRACWQRTITRWVKRGGLRFTFHDLRAKSASDSETIDAAYQRLGHTSMTMTRRAYDRGVRKVMPLK